MPVQAQALEDQGLGVPEAPSVLPPIQNPPATPAVPAPPGLSRPLKRKRAKTQALEEIRESRQLQMETNNLLKELVQEVKEQNVLKRRKLELLEQMVVLKKQKLEKM
ncbi:hypothetical protein FQR65_LT06580 [Abscondita terminalis]|nr:hypothetical protein FQR65_LT06775 [Abscondita terminalis]KAF5308012.1 hypothetical protein FQR65_LT06580 [Abscondita terminalis]